MEPVIVILVVAALIAFFVLRWWLNKRRREELQAWAQKRRWTFTERDDSFAGRFVGDPFGKGDHRKAHNVIVGSYRDRPVVAFEYSYETHSTDSKGRRNTTVHRYSVAAVSLPAVLPNLEVGREGFFSSIGRALGFHDIELEDAEFNKAFNVQADDRKFAYDILHPRMMQWLKETPGPSWRIERADLMCWDDGRIDPQRVEHYLAYLTEVVDQVPRFVWSDRGTP